MAQFLMSEYLSTVSAGYAYTLSVTPQDEILITPLKTQAMLFTDANEPLIVNSNDATKFRVKVTWKTLELADAETIMELWCDTTKANGMATSFRWYNPADDKTYVVNFASAPRLVHFASTNFQSVNEVEFLIRGNYV